MTAPSPTPKQRLIDDLVAAFRDAGNQDRAFDNLAAERLGVSTTDLYCLNAIENHGGITAGALAEEVGLTTGAVTGVVDRLAAAGYVRRASDPSDRRRVRIEVTPAFYARAEAIWGPLKADWDSVLAGRFTAAEIARIVEFLRATNEVGRRHLERIASSS